MQTQSIYMLHSAIMTETASGQLMLCMQVLYDTQRLELVRRVEIGPSVSAVAWHPKLNQIFIGTGACILSMLLAVHVAQRAA